jgi:stearoyl-CoA desaturase (Delta-9 desaturase)
VIANFLLAIFLSCCSSLGTTAGAHRLWTHRAYKAKLPVRILLMIFFTMGMHRTLITWCRDHRVHHKYSDTAADPHNTQRGFFFSHIGWIFMPKSPELKEAEKKIDLSDLFADPVVKFQYKYYNILVVIFGAVIPMFIPMYFWNETLLNSHLIAGGFRQFWYSHVTWSINSVNHFYGYRNYDKTIKPTQNIFTSIFSLGEGWHNFHHVFPFDYKCDEFGGISRYFLNNTTAFIDLCAKVGLVSDRKTATPEMIQSRIESKGGN